MPLGAPIRGEALDFSPDSHWLVFDERSYAFAAALDTKHGPAGLVLVDLAGEDSQQRLSVSDTLVTSRGGSWDCAFDANSHRLVTLDGQERWGSGNVTRLCSDSVPLWFRGGLGVRGVVLGSVWARVVGDEDVVPILGRWT